MCILIYTFPRTFQADCYFAVKGYLSSISVAAGCVFVILMTLRVLYRVDQKSKPLPNYHKNHMKLYTSLPTGVQIKVSIEHYNIMRW